jgi:hypothetical protein
MVDNQALLDELLTWFRYEPSEAVRFNIREDHSVDVFELEPGRGVLRVAKGKQFPGGKLPVVFGEFHASLVFRECGLVSLEGCPRKVRGRFVSLNNQLTNLVGGPKIVGGRLWITQSRPLVSLDGFPDRVWEYARLDYDPRLPLLRTLNCDDGLMLLPDTAETRRMEEIIATYKGQGRRGMFAAKKELIEAGFEGNARW